MCLYSPLSESMTEPTRLLCNGMLFSASFAGLEGCIAASIALSSAIIPKTLAATANAMLYLFFALSTFLAPQVVEYVGCRRAMLVSMAGYSLYLLAFLMPRPAIILPAAALGGVAGAVLWTAQGEYFTLNSLAYASSRGQTAAVDEGRAISLFAGMFAVLFQVCLLSAKPIAAMLLSVCTECTQLPFVAFVIISAVCTAGMAATRSFSPQPAENSVVPSAAEPSRHVSYQPSSPVQECPDPSPLSTAI